MKKYNLCTKNYTKNTIVNQGIRADAIRFNTDATNQTIVVDYLELNFEFELASYMGNKEYLDLNGNTYIEFTGNESKTFANIDNLYIDNRLIGEIKYNSKLTPDKEIVLLKIENSLLYANNFTDYITYLIQIVGFKLNHIARIDIAIDTINHNTIVLYEMFS